jgi:hypothetical protein
VLGGVVGTVASSLAAPRLRQSRRVQKFNFFEVNSRKKLRLISNDADILGLNARQDKRIISTYMFKYFD